jgi:hypothetical protein
MEQNVNPWKSNLTNGLILGLAGVVYSLIMYFLNLSLNKSQGYVFMIIQIVLLYFLLKSYRDNFLHGQISFGKSVGAGVIICLYYSAIMAVFTYILYTFIDTGLTAKQLAMTEDMMLKKGLPQDALDAAMAMQAKFMKPGIMSFFVLFVGVIWGTILSLLVSIFVKREGNPLIDIPEN